MSSDTTLKLHHITKWLGIIKATEKYMVKLILRLHVCTTILFKVVVVLHEMLDYIQRVISPELDVSEIKREELSKTLQQAIQEIQGKKNNI